MRAQQPLRLSASQCRQMALEASEEAQKAANGVAAARLSRQEALAAYLPKVEGSLSGIYAGPNIDMMGMELVLHGVGMAGLSLQQPLFAGGKIVAANRLARIGEECAELQQRQTRADLIAQADNAYYTYIAVGRKVRMLRGCMDYMQTLRELVQKSVEAEMATQADQLNIDSRLSEMEYNLHQAEAGLDLCRLSLCALIGVDFDTPIVATDTLFSHEGTTAGTSPTTASDLDSLPEMQLLQKNIAVKEQQQRMAFAEFLPQAGIGAGYSYASNIKVNGTTEYMGATVPFSQTYDQGLGYVMASVKVPLVDWGVARSHYRKAKLETADARLDADKNSRLLRIRAEQARLNLDNSRLLIATAERSRAQAEEHLRLVRSRYELSLCTLSDLLDAQNHHRIAETTIIEAQTQHQINLTTYLHTIGQLH